MRVSHIEFRRAVVSEADELACLLRRVREQNLGAIPPPVHSLADMRRWMREVVFGSMDVWVAELPTQPRVRRPQAAPTAPEIVGLMVLKRPDWLEHLYLDAAVTGRGLGSRFVVLAKQELAAGVQLWTFQSNIAACRFYERHGFVAVQWTDGDNEEGAPDVRYAWRPA